MVPTAVYTDCLWRICRRKSTATHKKGKRERRRRGRGRKGGMEEQRESFGEHGRMLQCNYVRLRYARILYQGAVVGLD
jgi:hypothetical protein